MNASATRLPAMFVITGCLIVLCPSESKEMMTDLTSAAQYRIERSALELREMVVARLRD